MMKKGFTLAEVLITLTIIGVVAVLTLPGLMTNTAEQQARTALKKMTNTFSQAAEMNGAVAGYNYSGITDLASNPNSFNDVTDNSLLRVFSDRLNVEQSKGTSLPKTGNTTLSFSDLSSGIAVYLKDGTAIYFSNAAATSDQLKSAPDGMMYGIPVLFDTNGDKGPNMVSSCTDGAAATGFASDDSTGDCAKKEKRFIKDIFMMKLRDASVYPVGAASSWMMDDKETTPGKYHKSPTATISSDS